MFPTDIHFSQSGNFPPRFLSSPFTFLVTSHAILLSFTFDSRTYFGLAHSLYRAEAKKTRNERTPCLGRAGRGQIMNQPLVWAGRVCFAPTGGVCSATPDAPLQRIPWRCAAARLCRAFPWKNDWENDNLPKAFSRKMLYDQCIKCF